MQRFIAQLLMLVLAVLGWGTASAQGLVINEVQASNDTTIADDDGEYEDWIEIYNASLDPIDLTDHFLSDDDLDPYKWEFPSVVIPGQGFLLIWASDKYRVTGNHIHTNFKLSSAGEEVVLSGDDGLLIDRLPPIALQTDWSVGHQPDGSGPLLFFDQPTPWAANSTPGLEDSLDDPVFSIAPGFFDLPVTLDLSAPDPLAEIRYTVDGSIPTETSTLYTAPLQLNSRVGDPNGISEIPTNDPLRLIDDSEFIHWVPPLAEVFKSHVIRARAFRTGHIPSSTVTRTYFVGPGVTSRYSFPVISLASAPENFFDDLTGIYVPGLEPLIDDLNYFQHGSEWERPVHVEFFEPTGTLGFAAEMGVRIHGAHSRELPLKSLRLYARSDYGPSDILYPIFPGLPVPFYKRLILRAAGQDQPFTYVADLLTQSVIDHMQIETQASRPAVVFLNGEYWGMHNIRERHDRYFVEGHYGIDDDDVVVLKKEFGFPAGVEDGQPGDVQFYNDIEMFVEVNDMGLGGNYEYVKTQMDVDSYRDFVIAEAFSANLQWSARMWRKDTDGYEPLAPEAEDGRLRWMIFDLDFGFLDRSMDVLSLADIADGEDLFNGLIDSPEFRTGFINRYADQLNTAFLPANTLAQIDAVEALFVPEVPEHIDRWQTPGYMIEHPGALAKWYTLMGYRRDFANGRPAYARTDILGYFNLGGTWNLTLDVSNPAHGSVRVNTIEIDGPDMPWQGVYFDAVPVTLEALPAPGYGVVGWSGGIASIDREIVVDRVDDLSVTANFLLGSGAVPDGDGVPGPPLRIGRFPDGDLDLQWSDSCGVNDLDYAVYMGDVGQFDLNDRVECSTFGVTNLRLDLPPGDVYFIVVPTNGVAEGSYGIRAPGEERPPSPDACRPQALVGC